MRASRGEALKVALLGCGSVGSQVVRLLTEQAVDLQARVGRPLELVGIAVRRSNRTRAGIDPALFTTDAEALVARPDIDLVIEVIGGIEPARSLILTALAHGSFFGVGAVAAPLVGLLGTDATAMGLVMLGGMVTALAVLLLVVRPVRKGLWISA